jgi:hypothetical protein
MVHELKTWPAPFEAMRQGRKTHEIRRGDRPFQEGDTLWLREYDPATKSYSGRAMIWDVTYVTQGGEWGLPPDIVVMSVRRA